MIKIKIKPLSVNEAWRGKRYKTDLYKNYSKLVPLLLPKKLEIPKGKLTIKYIFGFSNSLSDIDNPVKQFQDVLCKKYKFDDRRIYRLEILKRIVKK